MKKFLYQTLSKTHRESAIKRLRQMESQLLSPKARFAIPFLVKGSGFFKSMACMQNPNEIERLFDMVAQQKPKRLMEIGTAKGGALYLWCQAADKQAKIVSIDLPDGEFGGGYPSCKIPFYQSFCQEGQELHLLRADSHKLETIRQAEEIFAGEKLDVLFIDGDHTYEGVKKDFEGYRHLVKPGGMIAPHDILPRPDLPEIQVDRFWKEIKDQYSSVEIIGEEGSGRTIGWGVIQLP